MLALDYGSARCGCAVSDPTGVLATPIEPVLAAPIPARTGASARTRGRPRRGARSLSDCRCRCPVQTRRKRPRPATSRRRSRAQLPVPVELYDERFTTRLAERTGGRASEDSRAAAHLLEGWLAAGGWKLHVSDSVSSAARRSERPRASNASAGALSGRQSHAGIRGRVRSPTRAGRVPRTEVVSPDDDEPPIVRRRARARRGGTARDQDASLASAPAHRRGRNATAAPAPGKPRRRITRAADGCWRCSRSLLAGGGDLVPVELFQPFHGSGTAA